MRIYSNIRSSCTAGLLFLLVACTANTSKENVADKKQTDTISPPSPPTVNVSPEIKKCYTNDGLKYKTVITVLFYKKNGIKIVSGDVTSEESGSGETERVVFEGTVDGDKFMIKFPGPAPVVGDASEWTGKPWTIKKEGDKETLRIVFNAKNYDTNKWSETDYLFDQVDCK